MLFVEKWAVCMRRLLVCYAGYQDAWSTGPLEETILAPSVVSVVGVKAVTFVWLEKAAGRARQYLGLKI